MEATPLANVDPEYNPKPCWAEIVVDIEDIGETKFKLELDISPYFSYLAIQVLVGVAIHDNFEGGESSDLLVRGLEMCGSDDVIDFMSMIYNLNRFGEGDKAIGFTVRVKSRKALVQYLLKEELNSLEDEEYQELKKIYYHLLYSSEGGEEC